MAGDEAAHGQSEHVDLARLPVHRPAAELPDADYPLFFTTGRYKELFIQRREGRPFAAQDVRDLQMWSNLAWFGQEFRDGEAFWQTTEPVRSRTCDRTEFIGRHGTLARPCGMWTLSDND